MNAAAEAAPKLEITTSRQLPNFLAEQKLSLAVTTFFLWLGIRQFRKMEKSFADLI